MNRRNMLFGAMMSVLMGSGFMHAGKRFDSCVLSCSLVWQKNPMLLFQCVKNCKNRYYGYRSQKGALPSNLTESLTQQVNHETIMHCLMRKHNDE